MTTTTFKTASGTKPAPISPRAGGVVSVPFERQIDASAEITAAADKLRLCFLPAGHVVVDAIIGMGDLDGGSGLVWDLGIEDATQNPTDTTDANALVSGSTVGQAAGVQRMDEGAGLLIPAVNYDRFVTITITTPPATDADGKVYGRILYQSEI